MAVSGPGINVPVALLDVLQQHTAVVNGVQTALVSWYWHVKAITAQSITLGEAVQALDQKFAAAWKALISSGATYRGSRLVRVLPTPISAFVTSDLNSAVGTVIGDPLPSQVTGLITWYTTFGGRGFRGRSYVPFPAEADSDASGNPIASYPTRLTTLATLRIADATLVGANGTAVLEPVIFHRKTGTDSPITTYRVRGAWATQRRRGFFGRANPSPV